MRYWIAALAGAVPLLGAWLVMGYNPWGLLLPYTGLWGVYWLLTREPTGGQIRCTLPQTTEDAARELIRMAVERGEEQAFRQDLDTFIGGAHHGVGQWVRNNWGLWSGDTPLYRALSTRYNVTHGDDLSGLLLTAAWHLYRGLPYEQILQRTAEQYREHWRRFA